jgi:predicted aspartyl protease
MRGLLIFAVSIVADIAPASASDNCVLKQVTRLPLSVSADGAATVPMTIGGRQFTMAVDTGSLASALFGPAVAKLQLSPHNYNFRMWTNFDGQRFDRFVVAPDVGLGALRADSVEFGYVPAGVMPTDLDGTIGPSILKNYDVELDFQNGVFALYSRDHCPGQFSHWTDGEYAKVEFTTDRFGMISVPVELDGKEFRALIHTGYMGSEVVLDAISVKFGIDESNPALQRRPGGNEHVRYYSYPFKTLIIQGITVNNPKVELVSYDTARTMPGQHPLILGMDILRRLHLYIAYSEHVIYVTPATAR